ncbi:MAG: hypothetical protein K9L26_02235 [Candidatus Izimaplasma sp.]|nr:hypothetical protein [Candidatus Izimaplasma bacterium]
MKKRYIIMLLVILLFVVYTVTFNMTPSDAIESNLIEFDQNGFVEAETLNNTNKEVASNAEFTLYLDETTSHFSVVDKGSGTVWLSNPQTDDPWISDPTKTITQAAIKRQKATLILSYFNKTGSLTSLNNYDYSINHPASVLYDAGLRTYQIKYIENGFQILYTIEDVDIDYLYFPKYLKPEVLETLEDRDLIEAIAYSGYDQDLGLYEITQYEDMSRLVRARLYDVFYGEDGLGYTREQAIRENAEYGYTEVFSKVRFEVGVQVLLTDSGIKTSIIHDSIDESSKVKLGTVSLYPYFGTAVSQIDGNPTSGYMVVPDGSGAIINFNNGKEYQQPYSKRLYGEDFGLLGYKMPETQQKISIPVYGMIKKNSGFAAIITEGDAMATLNADVSGRTDSYNKIYPSFNFRENEYITLGSGFNSYGLDLWTEEPVNSDFTVEYTFLNDSEANYVGVANVYQIYLEEEFGFSMIDTSNETILTTEFIGAYDKKSFVFGIPYYANEALTTFDQAETIIKLLKEDNINNMNVMYLGMMNGGLSTNTSDRFNVEREVGGMRGYKQFLEYTKAQGIAFYPTVNVMTTSDYHKMFDRFRYTSSRIDGSHSLLFNYHLPSKLPYSETPFTFFEDDYIINPYYFNPIINRFLNEYNHESLSFRYLGQRLGGSYGDYLIYRQDALKIQQELLMSLDRKMTISNPLGYAIPASEFIVDLPLQTTSYAIFDYPIPLLQLVLSGKVDYTTESLNMSYERSIKHNFLKAIETGSNIKYTLSYEDSKELKNTEYNQYISTEYVNWIDHMTEQIAILDALGIHNGYLVNHEQLQNNVYQVTYSHGLTIIVNYNLSQVNVDGLPIDAMDYLVVEVD